MEHALYRVSMPVGNLGNSWDFDLGHSRPGICWKFGQSGWESTQKMSQSGKMTQQNNSDILEQKSRNIWEFCF